MVGTTRPLEPPEREAACTLSGGGAECGEPSGGVRLAAHLFDASDNELFAPADMARYLALPSYQCGAAVHASPQVTRSSPLPR